MTSVKTAKLLLQVGLAAVLIYATISAIIHPSHWTSYLPSFATQHFGANSLLKAFDFYELVLALWLLSGWKLKYAALLMMLTMLGAIFSNIQAIETTFRDIGLFFAAASLMVLAKEKSTR